MVTDALLTVEPDLLAGILAEQDAVASFDVKRHPLAIGFGFAVAGRDDRALLGLFLRAVGDDDSANPLFAFGEAVDDDLIVEGPKLHDAQLQPP